jgi:glyoxylase-like metal-dependent hydrolase (beta-lactamase superfamily II)
MTRSVFRLAVLPAGIGDALVIEYGTFGSIYRVLIDGGIGRTGTAVKEYLGGDAQLELLVVTHIDSDHIAGVLKLLHVDNPPVPNDIWFNGYKHLFPKKSLVEMGAKQGEALTSLIKARGYPWNRSFKGKAVVRGAWCVRTVRASRCRCARCQAG